MKTARFKIASKLGAFRNTFILDDPFGTGARFTILRAGSNEFQSWAKKYIDTDPMARLEVETILSGGSEINVLTRDEETVVGDIRKGVEAGNADTSAIRLLPIIDRLTSSAGFMSAGKGAMKKAIDDGRVKASDYFNRNDVRALADATKMIVNWENMAGFDDGVDGADGDGADMTEIMIDFTPENVHDLLTNDTPIEEDGPLAEIVKGIDALYISWEDETTKETKRVFVPNLTLGKAYIRIITAASNNRDNFRAKVMEEAGKNSEPSSDSIS